MLPSLQLSPPKVGFRRTVQKKDHSIFYLLHGIIGNHADWASSSRIRELAERNDLAVIMPSGDNSFYVDDERAICTENL